MNDYEKWLNGEISDSDLNHRQYGAFRERLRTIKLLDEFIENCDLPEVVDRLEWFKDALIKGEK